MISIEVHGPDVDQKAFLRRTSQVTALTACGLRSRVSPLVGRDRLVALTVKTRLTVNRCQACCAFLDLTGLILALQ